MGSRMRATSVGHGRSALASMPLSNYTAAWTIRYCSRLALAKCWISGSARRRTPRATSGFARTPRSTSESATRFGERRRGRRGGRVRRLVRDAARRARTRRCCSTSSRATSIATRRARSPATRGALATANEAVARGFDRELDHFERWFLYMPFEHSEDLAVQERSLALFGALVRGNRRPRAARLGREACGRDPPLRPLSASQCDPRPRVDTRGARVPGRAGLAVLGSVTKCMTRRSSPGVIPAKAGIQCLSSQRRWVPAFAGTTSVKMYA